MKKTFTAVLAVVFMLTLLVGGTFAASPERVMTVDGTDYTDFQTGWNAAIEATANNDNVVDVVLYADWIAANGSFGEGIGFRSGAIYVPENTRDLSLDLNGHTIDRGLYWCASPTGKPAVDKKRDSGEVMQIDEGSRRITVKNGTIQGANNRDYGGVYVDKAEELKFENITFQSNSSTMGGALYNNEGKVSFENCTFTLNRSICNGGAIYSDYDTVTVTNCTFIQNFADSKGGAIYSYSANFIIENSTFESNFVENESFSEGGALYVNGGRTQVAGSTFSSNYAYYRGGAVFHYNGSLHIESSTFNGNKADTPIRGNGGAIYLNHENATIRNCTFTNNSGYFAGAIGVDDTATIEGCTFTGNIGSSEPGSGASAIWMDMYAEVTLKNCTITENTGSCAVYIGSSMVNEAELWLDGKMIISDNTNADGYGMNLLCKESGALSTCPYMKSGFSKESLVYLSMNADDMRGEEAIEDIPSSWTEADLAKCFFLDTTFSDGDSCDDYYLELDGSTLEFHKGNPQNSIHAKAQLTGSILGEGSLPVILSLCAILIAVAALITVIFDKKRKAAR